MNTIPDYLKEKTIVTKIGLINLSLQTSSINSIAYHPKPETSTLKIVYREYYGCAKEEENIKHHQG